MTKQRLLEVAEQRAHGRMSWLQIHAPEFANDVRAGQFFMVRCAEQALYDPYLRRPLFVAASETALGQIAFLYAPEADPGLRWLSRARSGDTLDLLGPFGQAFELQRQTKTLLLVGEGPSLVALLFLARIVLERGGAATLLAAAQDTTQLPAPYLLPGAIEYQSAQGRAIDLLSQHASATLAWADQLCAALPLAQVQDLTHIIQRHRIRANRDFASVLLDAHLACGHASCGTCFLALRKGMRLACSDGPVFGLHEIA